MLERLLDKVRGADSLTRAARKSNKQEFAELFGRSTVLFLHVPEKFKEGLGLNPTQEEFLLMIREVAEDLKDRESFAPFYRVRDGREALLVFSQQRFAKEFAEAYLKEVRRIVPFQVLGVNGALLVRRALERADGIVLNARSEQECEISCEGVELLRQLWAK